MNISKVSFRYISKKPLNALLNILLFAFGTCVIIAMFLMTREVEENMDRNIKGIDAVVGAKGSPMQLILSSVFHIDNPVGNIPLDEALQLMEHPMVNIAIPLSLGDNYSGIRIVGTTHDYPAFYGAKIQEGRKWENVMEAVLGYSAAKKTGLKIGDKFYGAHGLSEGGHVHDDHAYVVKGILSKSNSSIDNLILTGIESVWKVHDHDHAGHDHDHEHDDHHDHEHDDHQDHDHDHEHHHHHHEHDADHDHQHKDHDHDHHHQHDHEAETAEDMHAHHKAESEHPYAAYGKASELEITAILIQYAGRRGMIMVPQFIAELPSLQAASPAIEVTRLFSLLGVGISAIENLAILIILLAALSVFIAMYNAMKEGRYDLALMRTLGASRHKLFSIIVLEGIIQAFAGALIGLIAGHAVLEIISNLVKDSEQLQVSAMTFYAEEGIIFAFIILAGALASLIPAISVYRLNISETLSGNS
jgi:putative ABC transport system permease protein